MTPDTWMAYVQWRANFIHALDPQLYPIAYLDHLISTDRAVLWTSENASIIATIKQYPGGAQAVHGLIAAGELEGIVKLIPLAEEWGRANGCDYAEIESREGWKRQLKADGYEPFQVTLRKALR